MLAGCRRDPSPLQRYPQTTICARCWPIASARFGWRKGGRRSGWRSSAGWTAPTSPQWSEAVGIFRCPTSDASPRRWKWPLGCCSSRYGLRRRSQDRSRASVPERVADGFLSYITGAPSMNTSSSPLASAVQVSSLVSGAVTTTATRSCLPACSAKFTLTSSSLRVAVANGCWRTT